MQTAYETMFLLPPTATAEQVGELTERLKKAIEKKHGEVVRMDKLGVRKTAYAVHKQTSAFYVLLQFRGTGDIIHEVERLLKNTDDVWKYLSTKMTGKAPLPTAMGGSEARAEAPAPTAADTVPAPAPAETAAADKPAAESTPENPPA